MNTWLVRSLALFFLLSPFSASALDYQLSGHLRGQGVWAWYPDNHFLTQQEDSQYFFDGSIDLRVNNDFFLTDQVSFEVAYEAAGSGGQSRSAQSKLPPGGGFGPLFATTLPSDDRQLFDLTKVFIDENAYSVYHRIDRLVLSVDTDYGLVKLGRQPLTWGNGLVFNPADLINPFAPTDIIRDYKTGTDMLLYQVGGGVFTDLQLVFVPRRNPENNKVEGELATFGSKVRVSGNELDFDLFALRNYEDTVVGAGLTGFLGGAVYRTDWTVTFLKDDPDRQQYLSAVANLDYSWMLRDTNWYGSLEIYYNGIGADNPGEVAEDPALVERLFRGELFVTGRWYLDTVLQYEAHPLISCFVSMILNLKDQSFLLQPRLVWDMTQSTQLLTGVNLPVGGSGDEFGERENPATGTVTGPAVQGYVVVTWFF
ncbi:MAG: hypothetical protein WBB19_09915 [Desulforhopalus sp.]